MYSMIASDRQTHQYRISSLLDNLPALGAAAELTEGFVVYIEKIYM